jgi:hypothetical protein
VRRLLTFRPISRIAVDERIPELSDGWTDDTQALMPHSIQSAEVKNFIPLSVRTRESNG